MQNALQNYSAVYNIFWFGKSIWKFLLYPGVYRPVGRSDRTNLVQFSYDMPLSLR